MSEPKEWATVKEAAAQANGGTVDSGMAEAEFWQQRFVQYDTQARALQAKVFELVAIGLTAVATLAGIAVSYERYEMFAFIPIVCLLLWAIAARMLHEHLLLSAFRDFCEEHATRLWSASLPNARTTAFDSWQKLGGRTAMNGWPNYYAFFVVAAITIGLVVGSFWFLFTVSVVPLPLLLAETIGVGVAFLAGGVVFVVAMIDHSAVERGVASETTRNHP